jgi:hypothetical protein
MVPPGLRSPKEDAQMFRSRFFLTALVAALTALAAPATSEAAFTVTITDSESGSVAAVFTRADNGVLGGFTSLSFSSNYIIGISANSSSEPTMVANNVLTIQALAGAPAATFTITSTADGFTSPVSPVSVQTNLTIISPAVPVTAVSQINGVNVSGTSITQSTAGAYTATNPLFDTVTNPYSVGNVLTLTIAGGGKGGTVAQVDINTEVVPAPAPAGLVMLISALPFAGILRLRRRKVEVATVA